MTNLVWTTGRDIMDLENLSKRLDKELDCLLGFCEDACTMTEVNELFSEIQSHINYYLNKKRNYVSSGEAHKDSVTLTKIDMDDEG